MNAYATRFSEGLFWSQSELSPSQASLCVCLWNRNAGGHHSALSLRNFTFMDLLFCHHNVCFGFAFLYETVLLLLDFSQNKTKLKSTHFLNNGTKSKRSNSKTRWEVIISHCERVSRHRLQACHVSSGTPSIRPASDMYNSIWAMNITSKNKAEITA